MSYKLTTARAIIRLADAAQIPVTSDGGTTPCDPDGVDGRSLLAWISAGGVPLPADPLALAPTPADIETQLLAALSAPLPMLSCVDLFKLIKAKAISDEAYRLGTTPALLTTLQLQALRQRLAAIYKAL